MLRSSWPWRRRRAQRRFSQDRDGSLLVWFALALVPLLLIVGSGVDYGRGVNLRTQMQNATDAAALAGATLYTGSDTATTAAATATSFMTAFVARMGAGYTITFTVTPAAASSGGTATLYKMQVSAKGSVARSLMKLGGTAAVQVATSSTATNPIYTVTLSAANFSSSASDQDTIYYYIVPTDNSAPAPSALNLLANTGGNGGTSGYNACLASATSSTRGCCSNNGVTPGTRGSGASATITITASQSIGFALRNVTGGQSAYSSNGYGTTNACINWFYSNVFPPSAFTYSGVTSNRSLQTATTPISPSKGSLSTLPAYATLNCAQASGKTVYYYWNDMGGGSDDLDYNDAQYTVTCAKNDNSAVSGVSLTQ